MSVLCTLSSTGVVSLTMFWAAQGTGYVNTAAAPFSRPRPMRPGPPPPHFYTSSSSDDDDSEYDFDLLKRPGHKHKKPHHAHHRRKNDGNTREEVNVDINVRGNTPRQRTRDL